MPECDGDGGREPAGCRNFNFRNGLRPSAGVGVFALSFGAALRKDNNPPAWRRFPATAAGPLLPPFQKGRILKIVTIGLDSCRV